MHERKPFRQLKARSLPLSVSFPMPDREAIEEVVGAKGTSVSEYIRTATMKQVKRDAAAMKRAA